MIDERLTRENLRQDGEQEGYPLTALQHGMLFHSLSAPEAGAYIQQLVCDLHEPLDAAVFRRAWEQLVQRHEALRTSYVWEGLTSPQQVLHGHVSVPWQEHDWRGLSAEDQQHKHREFLHADRQHGFDLAVPPLFRLALFRLQAARYQLVWTWHHALLDGRSRLVVVEELFDIYEAMCEGRTPALAPAASFRTLVDWLHTQNEKPQEQFWRQALAGFDQPSRLDFGGSSSGRPTASVVAKAVELSPAVSQNLHAFATDHGLTMNTLIQGAWAILLSHYTQQRSIVFGATRAGRQGARPKVARAVGMFINTVRLPVDGDPDAQLLPWLTALRGWWVALRSHERTSLAAIPACIGAASRTELFDSLVVFENYDFNARLSARGPQWQRRTFHVENKTNYPLVVSACDAPQIRIVIEHDGRFDDGVIERMLGHLQNVLTGFVEHPYHTLAQLPVLTEAERHQLLVQWNETTVQYPHDTCVHRLFEQQVALTPGAVAVVCDDQALTYGELNERANQLAHYLRSLGVGAETPVALCVERSVKMIVGLLGILKTGGVHVPLDADLPDERLAFMVQDTGAAVLLTEQSLSERVPAHDPKRVCLDSDWTRIAEQPTANPTHQIAPDHLAYVMYTSGSTGRPKGVAVEHRAIAGYCLAMRDAWELVPDDRVLQFASLNVDPSLDQILTTLISGARVVLRGPSVWTADEFLKKTSAYKVTVIDLTTAYWRYLCQELTGGIARPLASVRLAIVSGERMELKDLREWRRLPLGSIRLVNAYGPTEATITATYYEAPHEQPTGSSVPIGRPIANTQVYVLDRRRQPVSVGVPGELFIGGAGLARGYLNQPELTDERFVAHPFSNAPDARLYRTGDLCRWSADGNLEFLGRLDEQVKLRGFRIELGEIASVLTAHPDVAQSVVLLRDDRSIDPRLVAYCVPAAGTALQTFALSSYLRSRLPAFMVPAVFVTLDRLPLSSSGKVDRRALPAPDDDRPDLQAAYVAPRDAVEQSLADIWCELLGIKRVGIHDDFFALGGHSLHAIQLISRVRDAFAVELPVRSLFEAPTLAEFVSQIGGAASKKPATLPPLTPLPHLRSEHMSFAQERLLFLDQVDPGRATYNIPWALRLRGPLNVLALERSLQELIRRHEVLRTTFEVIDGQPRPVLREAGAFALSVTDLGSVPDSARETEARRLGAVEVNRPFNLAHDLMLRAHLLSLDDRDHVLVLTLHHIAADAWSLGVLGRELPALYEAFDRNAPSPLPELPIQYSDYAAWQRIWLSDEVLDQKLAYWEQQLAGAAPMLDLPTDFPRPRVESHRGAKQEVLLDATLTRAVYALSQREGVTPFMTLLAAFQVLLARYSGQDDVSVGTASAGRSQTEVEGLIGFFVNTLVLRTDLSANPTCCELLRRVREVTLGAYAHQDLPFEKLVRALSPERSLSHSPLFQVMFVLQNVAVTSLALPNVTVSSWSLDNPTAKFDLTLSLEEQAGRFRGTLEYNTDLFGAETIARLIGHFEMLLSGMVADSSQRIHALPLLTHIEQQQVLVDWNRSDREYPRDRCLHELFEAQVARTPDAVAVVGDDEQWTYTELNLRANQLAHHLMDLGVGPGVLVGLCVERSLEMIVGLLGILKAGGAYVPLDVALPAKRLSWLLEDSRVPVLVTTAERSRRLPPHPARVVHLNATETSPAAANLANPQPRASADDLAYVLYTSGSTGTPKGVETPHRAVVRLLFGVEYADLGASHTFLHLSPLSFDASTFEIWGALLHGARCVLFPEGLPTTKDVGRVIERSQVDTVWLTAALFNTIVDDEPVVLRGVRQLLIGGEALSVPHVQTALSRLPDTAIINGYGPTESTTFACTYRIPRVIEPGTSSIPIGRPISNTTVYVLDDWQRPVPVGVIGELYIGGDGLARGYLHRPDLTAEEFVADPFSDVPGARMYRTGDRVRWRSDGHLEFLGRLDHQVKLHGLRIELGEIETVLAQHPQVLDAVVLLREDRPGDKRLVAYVVSRQGETPPAATALRGHLQATLPGYMVPAGYVTLERLPLTPNGKVDYRALPPPDGDRPDLPTGYAAPRDAVEQTLADIWCGLLDITHIGIHDNFFELGGHSLLAIRVVSEIEKRLDCRVPLALMLEGTTIALLADKIRERSWAEAGPTAIPLHAGGTKPPLIFMPSISGDGLGWKHVLDHWDADQPVFALGWAGRTTPWRDDVTLPEMVRHYVSCIERVAPSGIVHLAGMSFGGLFAYEMARQLRQAGRHVGAVVIIDSDAGKLPAPSLSQRLASVPRILRNVPPWFLDDVVRTGPSKWVSEVRRKWHWWRVRLALGVRSTPPVHPAHAAIDMHHLSDDYRKRVEVSYQASRSYQAGPFDGRVVIICARTRPLTSILPTDLGWGQVKTGGLEVIPIKGNHESIMRPPHSRALAIQLQAVLDRFARALVAVSGGYFWETLREIASHAL